MSSRSSCRRTCGARSSTARRSRRSTARAWAGSCGWRPGSGARRIRGSSSASAASTAATRTRSPSSTWPAWTTCPARRSACRSRGWPRRRPLCPKNRDESAPGRRGRPCALREWPREPSARPGIGFRGAPARVGGRVALAAGGALVSGRARARGGGLRVAHAVPARPRSHRALQGVPAPQAQDAGLRGAGGRPLPHAADPHAGGDPDLAHGRAGAAAQRGPRRGDRDGARRRASAVRAHRRGRPGRLRARALRPRVPAQRALATRRRRAGAPQPHRAGARRHPAPLRAGRGAADAGGQDRPPGRPDRLHQPRHRRRAAGRRPVGRRPAGRRDRRAGGHGGGADRHAGPRPGGALGGGGRHRPGAHRRPGDAAAARVHVRPGLPGADGARRAREDRACAARAVRLVLRAPPGASAGRLRGGRPGDRLPGRDDRPLRHPGLDRALRPAGPAGLMARYTNDSRERVRDAVDFAELVGARTELRQAGQRRLTGLCPFHDERTPSFGIDPVEKLYHCFGCGEGGDVFKFVMETEGLDFTAALESLAGRYGVELERDAEDPAAAVRRERSDRLLALLERTAAYYVRVLWESEEASAARSYLLGRGLSEAALREFRVGYSPSAWDRVLTASQRAGFSMSELMDAGLAVRGRQGGFYDRFRGRIMFPLADERGRVRGFGARAMRDGQGPKYLNSNEGEVFHKGRFVYGGDLARAAAAREGRVMLVEGYTDVVALRQAALPNVVGSMGTALTRGQVEALSRLAPTVLFCLDADAAGQEAMARAAQEVRRFNADRPASRPLEFRIVPLPAGSDPADLVASDADALRDLLEANVDFATFLVRRHLESADLRSAEARDRVIDALRPTFAELADGFLYQELLQLVSDRLDSPPDVLTRFLPPRGRQAERPARVPAPAPERSNGGSPWRRFEDTERAFLARCLAVPEAGRSALDELELDVLFTSELTRRAARHLREHFDHPGEALPVEDSELAHLIAELVIRAGDLGGDGDDVILERLQLDLLRLNREIHAAERAGEPVGELARERQRVHEEIRHRLV